MPVRTLTLTIALLAATPSAGSELGFVYVRANVGGASGGHAALVADERIFHMQAGADGLVRLTRDRWSHFRYLYADLQNRPLEVAYVELEPAARERVLAEFTRLYVEQDGAFAHRDEAREDVAWLEAFRDARELPPLRGAGLLSADERGDPRAAELAARFAPLLAESKREAAAALAAGSALRMREYREALALDHALRALEGGYGLASEALVTLPPELDPPLDAAARAGLEARAAELERTLAELVGSRRPDRGAGILLTHARYLAVKRSLDQGRLVLLDPFDGARRIEVDVLEMSPRAHALAVAHAAQVERQVRALVLEPTRVDEPSYTVLEEAGGMLERVASARDIGALYDLGRRRLPARGRTLAARAPAGDLAAALVEAQLRRDDAQRALDQRFAYDLFDRNCITELVRLVDEAFDSAEEARQAMGGRIEPGETFGFVPFVFFDGVRTRLRVARVERVPSFRERELARVEREEPGAWTRARESITLSSTTYEPLLRDSAFLLFTDDVFWRRPLYGAANLAFASAYTVYGLGAAPFDRGARLRAGLLGAFWSLPELAFANVRKGSYEFVSAEAVPGPDR